ncbi:MAG: nitroreductase family protein [Bacteroidales bacterium]|nr:nitroreductase family protein [Bacteroidales bacterium]
MADNYLENRYDAVFGKPSKKVILKPAGKSIDVLLRRNRSYRGYKKEQIITESQLKKIVEVNTCVPSARNQQVLRFKLVTRDTGAEHVLKHIVLGGALPELHLPLEGTEPEAFIVVCSIVPETRMVSIDMGISVQSMLLKATEMGLNGIIIGAFDKEAVKQALHLPYDPSLIVAIGKGNETIQCVPIHWQESHNYYRQNNVHYVPKVIIDDLIL